MGTTAANASMPAISNRVLLVEDNPRDADLASARLAEAPAMALDVRRAETLAQASDFLSTAPVDAIVLDLNLPDSMGLDTLRRIKQASAGAPIIVVSGLVDERLRTDALADGAVDVFSKHETNSPLFSRSVLYVIQRSRAQEQHRKLERLLEGIPDAIFVVSLSGVVRYVNEAALSLFGRSRQDFIGELLGFSVKDGEPIEITIPRGGDDRICEVRVVPFEWQNESAFLASIRDVTGRKAIEMQLHQAQKMEAIGNLTGGIAHDFNNLLGVVIGNLDLMTQRQKLDPSSEECATEALDAALRGADLIQRLLAFARRQPLKPQPTDIDDLIARISGFLQRSLAENIELTFVRGDRVWPAVADPAQLEASLVNIANNARDAMPKGGALRFSTGNRYLDEDYASAYPGLAPGEYTMIEISDTGAGMAPEVASRIFEPFFTTKAPGKGSGLGLSMVFGFVKQSGGHVSVYSEVGVGTTFRLFLPRAGASASTADAGSTPRLEPRGHETVLAVEDNQSLRRIVARQITELGYRLLEAENGPSALRILESEKVDLLFTDIVMPGGMSGPDLARIAVSHWPSIKVVLTSGFPEAKRNGDDGQPSNIRLLAKPYRRADLARALREALDG